MAGRPNNNTSSNDDAFNSSLYLSPNQQDLLLAALTSNNPKQNALSNQASKTQAKNQTQQQQQTFGMDLTQSFGTPQTFAPMSGTFDANLNYDDSPFLDSLDADANYEYGFDGSLDIDGSAQMIGPLPGDDGADLSPDGGYDAETPDKRKSPSDTPEENGENKRHEGDEKTAKKPGRKPLTSEPTTVSDVIPSLDPQPIDRY